MEALSQGVVGRNAYGAHRGVESYTQSVAPQSVGPIHVHAVLVLAVAGRALSPVCPAVQQGIVLHPSGWGNDDKYEYMQGDKSGRLKPFVDMDFGCSALVLRQAGIAAHQLPEI